MRTNLLCALTVLLTLIFLHSPTSFSLEAIDNKKKSENAQNALAKGIAVVDPFKAVVYTGGEAGGSEAIVKGLEFKLDGRFWSQKIHTTGNPEVIQYFLPGEGSENWSELITIHKLSDQANRFNLDMIAKAIQSNPSQKVNIISQSHDDLIYDGFTREDTRYELVRVIMGDGIIFTLYYASRDMQSLPHKKDEWLKLLKAVKLKK